MRHAWMLAGLLAISTAWADGPQDNLPAKVRRVPKLGIEVSPEQKKQIEAGLAELRRAMDAAEAKAETRVASGATVGDLLVDVEIFHRAVREALQYQEFFKPHEIKNALKLIETGRQRAAQLAEGLAPWTQSPGLVPRGFVSRLDGTVQPYGLVVPETYSAHGKQRYRLDVWFHGRGETLSENNFLWQRLRDRGVYTPEDTIVLHPYGRYSNAFKFAGEVDVLEAIEDVKRRYRIDDERIAVRGFSMGGAACWQFATHYSDRWFAANPGAGFSETPRFLKVFQGQTLQPTWWEKKLWNLYDCDKWALNLTHCPTVAYSGEIDRQKQAADVMAEALAEHGIDLVHVIGPQTGHKVHPDSAREIDRRLDALARGGRRRVPRLVAFETHTLKYHRMKWVTVDGLAEHWRRAEVIASLAGPSSVIVRTQNVTDLTLSMAPGDCPMDVAEPVLLSIDGKVFRDAPRPRSDRSWRVSLHRTGEDWRLGPRPAGGVRKRHDLQGPIDDAFMDAFLFVRPTGQAAHEAAGAWAKAELERAIEHWRRHFRGHARVKDDTAVTEADIASANLILWGDPSSNAVLKKIAGKLPIRWDARTVAVGDKAYDAAHHAPILIHPNPLNPSRYVVLNSSFTFRDYAYLNNARQVPMLPDWAVIDLREPPNFVWPGKIAGAGFFDERWRIKAEPGQ